MKYKVLMIGRNKMLIGDFFQYLEDDFEMQTSSMRYSDIMSHVHYFKPDVLIYCMNKEEKERIAVAASLKEGLETENVTFVLTGDQAECEAFQNASGLGDLIVKKPTTARSIKGKVVEFLEEKKAAEIAATEEVAGEAEESVATAAEEKAVVAEKEAADVSPVSQDTEPAKKHVLVVDDDPMLLKLIKEQLKDSYTVATAINGAIALKFLENKKTDLIVLDYEMPNENGADVLEKIRKNPETAKLPVVFLTGVKDREKIKRLVDLKPQGYLLKPIEREKLIRNIKSIIG